MGRGLLILFQVYGNSLIHTVLTIVAIEEIHCLCGLVCDTLYWIGCIYLFLTSLHKVKTKVKYKIC